MQQQASGLHLAVGKLPCLLFPLLNSYIEYTHSKAWAQHLEQDGTPTQQEWGPNSSTTWWPLSLHHGGFLSAISTHLATNGLPQRYKAQGEENSKYIKQHSPWHKEVTTGRNQHHSRRFLQLPPPSRCTTGSTKTSPSSPTTGSTGTILAPQHFLQPLHQEAKPAKSPYHIPPPHRPHVSYLKQKPAPCSTTTSQAQVLALQSSSWCSAAQINSRWGCPSPLHLGHQVSCISLVVSKLVRKTKWSRSTGVVCDHKTASLTWSGKQAAKMSLKWLFASTSTIRWPKYLVWLYLSVIYCVSCGNKNPKHLRKQDGEKEQFCKAHMGRDLLSAYLTFSYL